MPRTARLVVPGYPHHIIQRGNRRQDVFFTAADYQSYLELVGEKCAESGTQILAYCLMPNHTHLIVRPADPDGLHCIGEVHRRYTRKINAQKGWQGHLWQSRFASYPMDSQHMIEAVRYIELNPVRAGICRHPALYRWSSARQRLGRGEKDLAVTPLPDLIGDWEAYWQDGLIQDEFRSLIENNEKSQKPLGNVA